MLELQRRLFTPLIAQIERQFTKITGRKLFTRVHPNAYSTALGQDKIRVVFDGQGNGHDGLPVQQPVRRPREVPRQIPEADEEMGEAAGEDANNYDPLVADAAAEAPNAPEEENLGAEHDGAEAAGEPNPAPNSESNGEILAEWQRRIDDATEKLEDSRKELKSLDGLWSRFWYKTARAIAERDIDHYEKDLAIYQGAKSQAETLVQRQADAYNGIINDIKANVRETIGELGRGDDQQQGVAQMFGEVLAAAEASDNFLPMLIDGIVDKSVALSRQIAQELATLNEALQDERNARKGLETEVQGLSAKLKAQEGEMQALEKRLTDEHKKEVQGLSAKLKAQEGEMQILEKRLTDEHQKEMQTQKAEISQLRDKLEEQGTLINQFLEKQQTVAPAARKQGTDRTATNNENVVRELGILNQPLPVFNPRKAGCYRGLDAVEVHSDSEDENLYEAAKRASSLSETTLASSSAVPVEEATNGAPEAAKVAINMMARTTSADQAL